jgi:FHS family L-fucose permease-like MFS transporter
MSPDPQGLFAAEDGQNGGRSLALTFALVASLFLVWGVCNGMIDVMDKHFQNELGLSKAQSAWVQFAHYLGYFLMAMPAGWVATRLGYKGGIITGLALVAAGGFWFVPATYLNGLAHAGKLAATTAFIGYLAGVCIIAAGLTFLETIANPYATVLGPPRYAATRINLAQSCNGIGWIAGPILGGMFFYSKNAAGESTGSATLFIPYLAVAVVVLLLIVVFYLAPLPDIRSKDDDRADDARAGPAPSIWKHPHFVLAVAAQFLYVAAQAGIFSFFINYLTAEAPALPTAWGAGTGHSLCETNRQGLVVISDRGAATLASVGFVLFLAGRFSGAALLRRIPAHRLLALYGACNGVACLLIFLKLGWLSVACLFASYFFMSIMFPTIFALGIFGLGGRAKMASSFIVMAIMGGAILPKVMGAVADRYDMSRGFIVPLGCFAAVAAYGYAWPRLSKAEPLGALPLTLRH